MPQDFGALVAIWPSVAGANTAEKLTTLNAKTVAGPNRLVPIADVMAFLRSNGLWLPIKAAAANNGAAAAAVDIAQDLRAETIDFDLPLVQTLLEALVQSNLLSQANANALNAMKTTTVTWLSVNGFGGAVCQNDLVVAGILTDAERIAFEVSQGMITQEQADHLTNWNAALAQATPENPTKKIADGLLRQGIGPLGPVPLPPPPPPEA